MEPRETDITKLKYALYARKSTEDEGRQVRSIKDQINDCLKLATDLGISVSKPYIEETKSAKTPHRRDKFTQLLKDVKNKKYDGILCWHPDRLARNMIEAGQIIDMLDNRVLKDLRFVSHQFSNDANGKMLLGMLFVFSKHYSDDLSQKVNRGVKGNFAEGKSSGAPKHGYDRDSVTGLYKPIPKKHDLIKEAWRMRSENLEIKDIITFLNDNGYHRKTRDGREIKATVGTLSKMFQDPFYYGVLVQAGQTVDLNEVYNFVPATNRETYERVQEISYSKSRGMYRQKKNATFYPLRQFVICAFCENKMYVGKSQPQKKKYLPKLYYRCEGKNCSRRESNIPVSVRAKVVFDWVQQFLETDFKKVANEYDRYSALIDEQSDTKRIQIKTQISSKQGALNHIHREIDERAMALSTLKAGVAHDTVERKLEELENEAVELEALITRLKDKLTDKSKMKLNKEQFLNLIETAPDKMKAGTVEQKDRIVRIIFLNLKVGDQKVDSYLCNEPFASMLELAQISSGRGCET